MKYKVIESFLAAAIYKSVKSNVSIGNARLWRPVWMPLELNPGDLILSNNGAVYKITPQNEKNITIAMEPKEFAPLENKTNIGNDFTNFPKDCLECIQ